MSRFRATERAAPKIRLVRIREFHSHVLSSRRRMARCQPDVKISGERGHRLPVSSFLFLFFRCLILVSRFAGIFRLSSRRYVEACREILEETGGSTAAIFLFSLFFNKFCPNCAHTFHSIHLDFYENWKIDILERSLSLCPAIILFNFPRQLLSVIIIVIYYIVLSMKY